MNFHEVEIRNFLGLEQGTVKLENRGLLLIEGENQDETSANSNGAGKSSVADAICWCLYGKTARGVTGDDVVNKKIGKNCQVCVTIRDGDDAVFISRTRKGEEGNDLEFCKNDWRSGSDFVDMTKSSIAETQAEINKFLGASYEIFTASIYAGQENMPDLPAMTDKTLKLLIEEAAGIDKLQKAYELAKHKANFQQNLVDLCAIDIEQSEKRLAEMRTSFDELDKESLIFEQKKEEKIAKIQVEIDKLKEEIENLKSKVVVDEDLYEQIKESETLKKQILDFQEKADAVKSMELEANTAKADFLHSVENLKKDGNAIRALYEELENIKKKVGTKCAECGKIYNESDLAEAREILKSKILVSETAFNQSKADLTQVKAKVQEMLAKCKEEQAKIGSISALVEKKAKIDDLIDTSEQADAIIESLESRITCYETDQIDIIKEPDIFLDMKIENRKRQAKLTEEIEKKKVEKELAENQLKVCESVAELYSTKGVRAFILDTVTPFLNERTAEYLNTLSDGSIRAVWQTLAVTGKGDIKEKFNIQVTSDKGAKCFAGLSGGEKRKVRVATSMALQDLVASRATKPINLYIADEVDHALDASGLERLMQILEAKAEKCGTVLVISHNSLKDWITNSIKVVKKDGLSHVEYE